jgi:septin family protein
MSYEADVLKFKHQFTFCVIGPIGSGKTVFLKNLLNKHNSLITQNVQKIL